MPGFHPLLARRHFLATAMVGTIGALVPVSCAHAETGGPGETGADTLSPTLQAAANPVATSAGSSLSGSAAVPQPTGDTSIRPFKYRASDEELADLKRRIRATKWPDRETVNDDTQGVQLAIMRKVAEHWVNHDWRRAETQIFSYPNFVTNIDGLDVHFIHVRSKHPNALPVIITHGWPGSVIEQLKIIDPLTNPTAHGGTEADAFDVVIPSLPGYGFSGKPTAPGWTVPRIATAWAELMKRLGYKKYVAQGGDWGNAISEVMALQQPPGLLAIHTNMSATLPETIRKALPAGPPPAGLSPDEQHAWEQLTDFYVHGLGYAIEMNQRPQTLYALADSPVGLAAWMLDHDADSYAKISHAFLGGEPAGGLTRDAVLDNITLYWLTGTGASTSRLYWEYGRSAKAAFKDPPPHVKLPVAYTVFPDELFRAPRHWVKHAYHNLTYFNEADRGGHFAAWEEPELFAGEMRAAFKSLR